MVPAEGGKWYAVDGFLVQNMRRNGTIVYHTRSALPVSRGHAPFALQLMFGVRVGYLSTKNKWRDVVKKLHNQ